VRPTSDRVREAVFGRLGDLSGKRVLDLYAGTGALAIESLSRGARSAVFVDRAARSLRVVRTNLARLGLEDRSRVVQGDAAEWAKRLGRSGERFDLILVDPPYESDEVIRGLSAIVEAQLLDRGGTVVLETAKRHALNSCPGLRALDERCYGDTRVTRLEAVAVDPGLPGEEAVRSGSGKTPVADRR
jgi:16S rRNA (guanine966-N2)-methyltransferase